MSKIKEEYLEQLRTQEQNKSGILTEIGILETNKSLLCNMFSKLMSEQEQLKNTIKEEYGNININLSDGSYEEEVKEE
jgi:thioredoxin-related protein